MFNSASEYPAQWSSEAVKNIFSSQSTTASAQRIPAHSSSISTGAIAGATVGGLLLLLLLVGLCCRLVRRRRRLRKRPEAMDTISRPCHGNGAHAQRQQYMTPKFELSGHDRKLYPYELHGVHTSTRVELEAPAHGNRQSVRSSGVRS